jgi:hypothetical protein
VGSPCQRPRREGEGNVSGERGKRAVGHFVNQAEVLPPVLFYFSFSFLLFFF